MEGIMMRGPEKICCAVRRPDGTIDLSYSDVTTHWYNKFPWCAECAIWWKT